MAGLLVASISSITLADGIYKSVDAQGHVGFFDRHSGAGAQKTEVAIKQGDPHEAARLAKERLLMKAEDEQRKKQQSVDARNKSQQDAIKKDLCKNSRDRYNFLTSVNRLFVPGTDGNREYYTDAQLEAMRDDAKRTMNAACGT